MMLNFANFAQFSNFSKFRFERMRSKLNAVRGNDPSDFKKIFDLTTCSFYCKITKSDSDFARENRFLRNLKSQFVISQ